MCRSHAQGSRAVLWFHTICSGAERAGLDDQTSTAPYRHALQAGPEVGYFLCSYFIDLSFFSSFQGPTLAIYLCFKARRLVLVFGVYMIQ